RVTSGQRHDETVDPQAEAASRRHPVLQRLQEVLVERLRLLVAGAQQLLLLLEATPLLVRVVQLAERVGELDAADKSLEALDDSRLGAMRLRERRQLYGIVEDEGGLHELRL